MNNNSILPFIRIPVRERLSGSEVPAQTPAQEEQDPLYNAIGITQFGGTLAAPLWCQVLGGLIVQGGRVNAVPADAGVTVPFFAPYPKQVLGIFLQSIYTPAGAGNENTGMVAPVFSLAGFDLINDGVQKDFFWWSIGV